MHQTKNCDEQYGYITGIFKLRKNNTFTNVKSNNNCKPNFQTCHTLCMRSSGNDINKECLQINRITFKDSFCKFCKSYNSIILLK